MTKRPSIDGFVPRRSVSGVDSHNSTGSTGIPRTETGPLRRNVPVPGQPGLPGANQGLDRTMSDSEAQPLRLSRTDIDESLNSIDESPENEGRRGRKKSGAKKHGKIRRIIKWSAIIIVVAVLCVVGWVAYRALSNTGSVFKGGLLGLVEQKKLKQDQNGRTNVLVLGTSEDDPGHGGAYLTDSIMILSVDQTNKNAYMVSIPRDLYVKYGMACNSGYAGKINEYFNCINDDYTSEAAEDDRQTSARKFFGDIVGLDVQYSVHVNYTVMRDLVSALGGITVTIESRDPNGQMDSNFDWKCGVGDRKVSRAEVLRRCPPHGHFIDYPNGPVNLDAEHALYLAQARGDSAPTYGFEQSNFDREKNQQKILVAIREKATNTGTLTDIGKVTNILDALGKNLRTNFDTSEVRTLADLGKNIPSASIQSISLIDAEPPLVTTSNVNGMSVVIPSAGLYDYSKLQAYINKKINASPVSQENAHVIVLNASGVPGAAQTEADKLEALGMTIDAVDNAPAGAAADKNVIYQVTKKAKTATATKLKQLYSSQITVATSVPGVTLGTETEYVVVIGKATEVASSSAQ